MISLENETIKSIKRDSFDKCKIRKKYFSTINGIENNIFIPMTIGCLVVFALKSNDGYEIILQERSQKNLTSNAVTSIAPTFGLSPFIGKPAKYKGLLYYNFLREYLEELHCIRETTDLIKEQSTCRSSEAFYELLYNIEQAKRLIECADFNLYYIGFGFNLTNGNSNIGLLAKLDDLSISQYIKRSIFTNWELDSVQFVNSKSKEFGMFFSKKLLDP
ncbi:MAG: hypothetical protein ACFFDN_49270, partial [Candidatus Hodarchaeota archaeon]